MTESLCKLCGKPMPAGEEMFQYHGYSGPCPAPAMAKEPDPFETALQRLASIHTAWDEKTGMNVIMGATLGPFPPCSQSDYVEAWRQIRMHLSLNVNPSPTPAE